MAQVCEILVVEDDAYLGELVRDILGDEGYRVTAAADYPAAAAALTRQSFDFVLLDTPGAALTAGDWDRMARLRGLAGDTPMVLFTAHHQTEVADSAARGFHAVIHKPFGVDDLLAVVNRALPDECVAESKAA